MMIRRATPLVVLLTIMAVTGATAHADPAGFDPRAVYKVPRGNAPASGPVDALVTIVAWSDYACAYCNRVQGTLDHLAFDFSGPGPIEVSHGFEALDATHT